MLCALGARHLALSNRPLETSSQRRAFDQTSPAGSSGQHHLNRTGLRRIPIEGSWVHRLVQFDRNAGVLQMQDDQRDIVGAHTVNRQRCLQVLGCQMSLRPDMGNKDF